MTSRAELFDHVSSALTVTSVMAIKGTYGASCTSRTGAWTIALNGYALITGETALTVVTSDAACTLSVTEVKAGVPATPISYKPAAPFVLAANYATTGPAFMTAGTGPTQFYANFRLQPDLAFNSDFVLQMVYSDNVSETDLNTATNYVVVVSTATAAQVPAPNATLALSALTINVDAHNIVKSVGGSVTLTEGTVIAEFYMFDFDTVGTAPSYAAVDTAYNAVGKTRDPIAGASQMIELLDLNLVGLDLTTPKKRNLILANIQNGVNSYQLFQITFSKPNN